MVSSVAASVGEYLAELTSERSEAIKVLLKLVDSNIPAGFTKEMRWGMITYSVPLEISGPTYNKQPLACLAIASQKNYISIYLMSIYASAELTEEFEKRWTADGSKLDMGKSCIRVKSIADCNLDAVAWAASLVNPAQFAKIYLAARANKREQSIAR